MRNLATEGELLHAILAWVGVDDVFFARKEAILRREKQTVTATGKLLGGKLTVSIEFDELEQPADREGVR